MKQTIEIEVPEGYKAVYNEDTQKVDVIKIELPKTWEEFCENNPMKSGECFLTEYGEIIYAVEKYRDTNFKTILPNEETAEAFMALMQLIQLRNCYRQGWKPNWHIDDYNFIILYSRHGLTSDYLCGNRVLSFQSKDICEEFLKNFKDLIEKAKYLI